MLHELEHLPKHITNYIQQPPKCPLLAQSGHPATEFRCPLLGVKRTLIGRARMSDYDPKRTLLSATFASDGSRACGTRLSSTNGIMALGRRPAKQRHPSSSPRAQTALPRLSAAKR